MSTTVHSLVAVADGQVASEAGWSTAEEVTLTGQLGAVQWNADHTEIRLYCPDQDPAVMEYSWQGGDPWIGVPVPPSCSGSTRAAAVHWHRSDGNHLRLYCQDKDDNILEWCYDGGSWNKGQTISGACTDTGLAALAIFNPREDSIHLLLYYQASVTNQIIETIWNGDTKNGWVTSHVFPAANAKTGIAAVYFLDEHNRPHKRLYYQDTGKVIVEQCSGGEDTWALGQTFDGALDGTAIAATHWWRDGSHVRLYYQETHDEIVEQCYDTASGWFAGHTFTQVASSTGLAAVGWDDDSDNHVRVYYKDAAPYEGTYHAVIEQCYDGGDWNRGSFIARAS